MKVTGVISQPSVTSLTRLIPEVNLNRAVLGELEVEYVKAIDDVHALWCGLGAVK